MDTEYEVRVLEIDHNEMVKKLESLGAEFKFEALQQRYVYVLLSVLPWCVCHRLALWQFVLIYPPSLVLASVNQPRCHSKLLAHSHFGSQANAAFYFQIIHKSFHKGKAHPTSL